MSHTNGATNSAAIPHFELREILAEDVDQYWERMLPEIKDIIARSPDVCDFLPEEIYVFLRRKVAWLHVGYLDGEYAGFGILQIKKMPFSQERYLLSWIGGGLKPEAVDLYFVELENIARKLGIKRVRHESTRIGWLRRLPGPGWKLLSFQQEKRLD